MALASLCRPTDWIGVRSHNWLGRSIRWCSTSSLLELSPDAPNHLAQILPDEEHGPLWWEASVTSRVRCVFCGEFKGVHARRVSKRLREEIQRGSTIYRYSFTEAFKEAELEALVASWKAKHGAPYDYWGAYDARLRGAGRLLARGWYKYIKDRSTNGKWFCNEACLGVLLDTGRWGGNPSRWNPATIVADFLKRGVITQKVLWEPRR